MMMGEKIYCGLDIGSQQVKAALLKVKNPSMMELIALNDIKAAGIKDGVVSNLGELSECVHQSLDQLNKQAGTKIKDVQLGLGSSFVESTKSCAVIPLTDRGSKVILFRDINKINHQCRLLGLKMEEDVVHDFPQNYFVDDINSVINPIGLYGRKLEVASLLITTHRSRINNLVKAVNQAGYEVVNSYLSSWASSVMSLDEKSKKEGCMLLDIGMKVTTVLIFKDGILRFFDKIPLGGAMITQSIANQLNLPFDLAEDLKKTYAQITLGEAAPSEDILIKRNNTFIPIKRDVIYEALKSPVTQLVDCIKQSIANSGLAESLNMGVIAVGGGALLPGLIEKIEREVNRAVKLGVVNVPFKKAYNAALFSSAIGLAFGGWQKSFGFFLFNNKKLPLPQRWVDMVKEFYYEYF